MNDNSINNTLPLYWLSPERLMIFHEGKAEPIEMSVACDPASWEGDYGCKAEYKVLPDGSLEIVSLKYSKPRKKKKRNRLDHPTGKE